MIFSRHFAFALALAISAPAAPVFAHPGHDEELAPAVSRSVAEGRARSVVQTLIKNKVLEPSWAGRSPSTAELKTTGGAEEWVVTFKNDTAKDATKRTLYVFLSAGGEYVAANHTGQ
jgi:hypothetical protein